MLNGNLLALLLWLSLAIVLIVTAQKIRGAYPIVLVLGLVIFTSVFVAYFSAWLIPGFTLATGFLLGGIISPPDAVAATTVLSRVPLPKRILTILEAESLVNDASGLIIFRFALATVLTGHFSANEAIIDFFLVTIMGIICGMGVASVIYLIQRYLPSSASVSSAFTLLALISCILLPNILAIRQ